jgi:Helicase conserved C-terminal domain
MNPGTATTRKKKSDLPRCPKGTRRNPRTNLCEPFLPKGEAAAPAPQLEVVSTPELDQTPETQEIYATTLQAVTEVLYPRLDDPEFGLKIAQKKQFYDTRYDGRIVPIREETERRCRAPFELLPHQLFVKNFLSMQTPYNSLLLYHGLGTGKTLSAIGIAEEMRSYMKQVGVTKRILVLASPNVINNFRLQLFDENRMYQENGLWHGHTSVSQSLLDEINPTHLKDLNKQQIVANVNAVIKTFYDFKGYIKFSNEVAVALKPFSATDPRRIRKIQSMFNNGLIVIDEVHNIRLTRDNQDLTTANYLMMIAKYAKNVRFVLLSATPMYNSYKEIIWLTNLMNLNDRRPEITADQVFGPTGEFRAGGEELLRKKLTGYVSYVRGENPYTFPFRMYQTREPEKEKNVPALPTYVTRLGTVQESVYRLVLARMTPAQPSVPIPPTDASAKPKAKPEVDASAGSVDTKDADGPLAESPVTGEALRAVLENLDNVGYEQLRVPIQALNIVFQAPKSGSPDTLVGKQGLDLVVDMTKNKQFTYHRDQEGFFELERLRPFSHKITTILDRIRGSVGIVMIYSEFIYGGVVPMALALEEAGFVRAPGIRSRTQSMFVQPPTKRAAAPPLRYAMITGDQDFSPDNREELAQLNDPANRYGDRIKVVLISRAGAEGLDFKNIRQIHIMEPWYNLSRIEQIIGRGVRNLSHCDLPFEERNVEIYMHASTAEDERLPAADAYLYELSFNKGRQIGRVSKVLKSIAVDCLLNRSQQDFTVEKLAELTANQQIKIRTSTSGGLVDFQPGDRPYTAICDYSDSCEVPCQSDVPESTLAAQQHTSTYTLNFLQANRVRITDLVRQIFREQPYYPGDVLVQSIQATQPAYSVEQIYYALTYLLQNRNEYLVDSHGRLGHLINRGDIYAFQPVEISDESISVFDRTFPVETKVSKVRLELPKTLEGPAPVTAVAAATATPTAATATATVTEITVTTWMDHLAADLADLRATVSRKVKTNRQSWTDYMHAGDLVPTLRDMFGWNVEDVERYMIHHAVDVLPPATKRRLADHFLQHPAGAESDTKMTVHLREYMSTHIHRIQGREFLVLANEKNAWEVFKRSETGQEWVPGQYTDTQLVQRNVVEPLRRAAQPREERFGSLIGFFTSDTTKERWVTAPTFKVKDFTRKTTSRAAKGENLLKAGKKREVALIQLALSNLGEVKGAIPEFDTPAYNQSSLNVLMELLVRHGTSDKRRLFLNPEMYAMLGVLF